ncbi:MAG: zf-HC2 domain-containing protein [Acidobacteriota bacterium]|nr:zf-HC2 domain-containing protein [Acidobacteriota bacterium]
MNSADSCLKKEQIFAYSSNMLGPGERSRAEAHLLLCPSCRKILAGYETLGSVLGEWKPAQPSPWFDARVRARIASAVKTRPWYSITGFGWKQWTAAAAVAILAVGTSFIVLRRPADSGRIAPTAKIASNTVPEAKSLPQTGPARKTQAAMTEPAAAAPAAIESASQEMDLYEHLKVLENFDMLANFDVLSELPQASDKTSD